MRVRSCLIPLTAAAAIAFATQASADAMIREQKVISSAGARAMVDACTAWAERNHQILAMSVLDWAGNLIESHAMEGAAANAIDTALLKAKSALRWRRATSETNKIVRSGQNLAPTFMHDFPQPGALPIMVGSEMIGAMGVSSGDGEKCAQAAIDAVLKARAASSPQAQTVEVPQFQYDPSWPKPLPDGWVLGSVGSVCVDARDHVFVVTRGEPAPKERNLATPAPPVVEFDADGNVVNSWGNPESMAKTRHGCFIDKDGNFWTAGNNDGIVQKYTHDGSKMLLQIGTKGVMDSADGTSTGKGLNASHTLLFKPTQVAVDPGNGDVYVSDGYGNKRVVVFDREGHYLRQWGRQGTQAETDAGVGGVFLAPVHCVMIGNDGLVYVCDRLGDRIEVFDKMGDFKRNIRIQSKTAHRTNSENAVGTAGAIGFSPDPAQKFMYVANGSDNVIHILDRTTGEALSKFGRSGNQSGDFTDPHSIAVNSKGDIIVGEVPYGGKIQMWRAVRK